MIKSFLKAKFVAPFMPSIITIVAVIFLVLLVAHTSSMSNEMVEPNTFYVPFADDVTYHISSEFGYRNDPINKGSSNYHTGMDLVAPEGTDILSSCDGEVIRVGHNEGSLGNFVFLKHNIDGKIIYTAYGHMFNDSIIVEVGQHVDAKQKIGVIGSTGRSTGNHLHFSVMTPNPSLTKDNLVNPREVLTDLK